jgi:hypothetical protein
MFAAPPVGNPALLGNQLHPTNLPFFQGPTFPVGPTTPFQHIQKNVGQSMPIISEKDQKYGVSSLFSEGGFKSFKTMN